MAMADIFFDPNPVSGEEEKNKVEANGLPEVWVYNLLPKIRR
jgi:hypothetical protein